MKYFIFVSLLLVFGNSAHGQSPNQINFQGVLRDNAGTPLKNQQATLSMAFTNANSNAVLYRETHNIVTDNFGLFQISLGTGTPVTGTFQSINWSTQPVAFGGTATLPSGINIDIPVQRLLSVPYALHSNTATSLSGANDADVTNELNQSFKMINNVLRLSDAGGEMTVDLNSLNQTLSLNGNNLAISNGNSIDVSSLIDADGSTTNELNTGFTLTGTTLTVTDAGGDKSIDLASIDTDTDEQTLSFDGTTLTLSGGNNVDLTPLEEDADANPENELNLNFVLDGSTLKLTDLGGELSVDLSATNQNATQVPFDNTGTNISATHVQGALAELAGDLAVVNTDAQTLSFNGSSLSISGGNNVNLSSLGNDADANPTNEIQHLSISGGVLSLTGSDTQVNLTGLEADDQNASQVPYTNTGTQLTATNVQSAINELATALTIVDTDDQQLSFDGSILSIAGGNNVNLSSLEDDADANPTNEIQHLSINGTTISLSGSAAQVNLTGLGVEADDQNASQVPYVNTGTQLTATNVQTALNEVAAALTTVNTDAQQITFTGTTLSIDNGNSVDLSSLENDADADPENEIQHLSISGTTISLSGSNTQVNLTGLGVDADDQNASQVPYSGTASNMDATNVQTAIEELAAEKVRNLQEAYNANSLITLDGTHELRINTSTSQPLFATENTGRIGINTSAPNATLDVSSSGADIAANLEISNADNSHRIFMFPGRTSDPNPFLSVMPTDPLRFASYDATTFTEFGRFSPNGRFGLGTSSPQSRLHVEGVTSNLTGPLDGIETNFNLTTEAGAVFQFTKGSDQSWTSGLVAELTGTGTANAVTAHSKGQAVSNRGVYGFASGATGSNLGVVGNAYSSSPDNVGVRGLGQNGTNTNTGILGNATGVAGSTNYGGYFAATGTGVTNYGIFASAGSATTNWAGWFQGNVRVQGALSVNGQMTVNGRSLRGFDLGNFNFALSNGMTNITTGQYNVSLGPSGFSAITTGTDNIGAGSSSLNALTTGNGNIALGRYAMIAATGGDHNVAIGSEALRNNSTGIRNIGLGYLPMRQNTTGSNNIGLGVFPLDNNVSGSDNIVLGRQAGAVVSSTNDNILIGRNADLNNNTINRAVAIGYNAKAGQDDAIILGSGDANVRVGIGTSTPTSKLHVVGDVLVTGNVTATNLAAPSDRRLKTNIKDITDALEKISQLEGVSYNWIKDDPATAKTEFGLIAQELEKVIPQLVNTNSEGFKSVNYTSLIPFLIEAIKQQQKQISDQQGVIDSLKKQNEEFTASIQSQMQQLIFLMSKMNDRTPSTASTNANEKH